LQNPKYPRQDSNL